jgi:hypothetical protein
MENPTTSQYRQRAFSGRLEGRSVDRAETQISDDSTGRLISSPKGANLDA